MIEDMASYIEIKFVENWIILLNITNNKYINKQMSILLSFFLKLIVSLLDDINSRNNKGIYGNKDKYGLLKITCNGKYSINKIIDKKIRLFLILILIFIPLT